MVKKCCFIGHKRVEINDELEKKVYRYIECLIANENVIVFLFGSYSNFNFLCHNIVSELKEKYPNIVRVGYACESEMSMLEKVDYIQRNQTLINNSDYCLFYYDENYLQSINNHQEISCTALAYDYAKQKKKRIKNIFKAL